MQGRTAAATAEELGEGCTRNMVIGAWNRLGLRSATSPVPFTAEEENHLIALARAGKPCAVIARELGRSGKTVWNKAKAMGINLARQGRAAVFQHLAPKELKVRKREAKATTRAAERRADIILPGMRMLPLTGLTATTCRWPVGDPKEPGFAFCGIPCPSGRPYCDDHAIASVMSPEERRNTFRPKRRMIA